MKQRMLMLMVLMCLMGSLTYGAVIVIDNPSFEFPVVLANTNNIVADGWALEGSCHGIFYNWATDGMQNQFVGNGSGGIQAVLYQTTGHVVKEGDQYQLKFDARMQDNNAWPGGYEGTLYYDDGTGVRVALATAGATYDGTITWGPDGWKDYHAYTIDYTVGAGDVAIGKNLGFAFQSTTVSGAWNSYVAVDNVRLDFMNSYTANTPTPEDGELFVNPSTNLGWVDPPAYTPTGFLMSLRANDPNFLGDNNILDGVAVTPPYDHPSDLLHETTYFWRIDSIEAGTTTHEGSVWSFTTAPANAVITLHPVPVTVAVGDVAVFTAEGVNADAYTWKRQSTGATVQTDGPGTSSTLTISVVGFADEDYYYCEASNQAGVAVSDSARLLTERLISQWTFEGDLTEELETIAGTYSDPNATNPLPAETYSSDSIEGGQSFSFGDEPYHVVVDNAEHFNYLTEGYTVSGWIKVTETPNDADSYIVKNGAYGFDARSNLRVALLDNLSVDPVLNDGGWHHTVATYDSSNNTVRYYVDGVLNDQFIDIPLKTDDPVIFGVSDETGAGRYKGLLDDVRMYTYAIDSYDVAHLYTDVMTEAKVCVDRVGIDFDISGPEGIPDCMVDLYDFAEFAAQWLNCNMVPDCK